MLIILLVDDNKQLLESLSFGLKYLGHDIQTANNGQEALNLIIKQKFDLIISDYNMPVMDGLELRVEMLARRYDYPMIIVTANVEPITEEIISGLAISAVVEKPYLITDIETQIRVIFPG